MQDTAPHIARENNLTGYPTTILLDEAGKKLIQIPGFIGKKDFKTVLAYLTGKHYKKMPLIDYLKKEGVGSRGQGATRKHGFLFTRNRPYINDLNPTRYLCQYLDSRESMATPLDFEA
ncbi:MAG: hypothetical protein KA801_08415 [Syntrophorhabdaceae bacterium]|nr:hypothetical protein [Syntrophorhabdaceae bacterium]